MLNNINKPIVKAFSLIQNAIADNSACETLEQECAFMVAGGKERVYLQQLATKLTGNIIARLSGDIVTDEIITVYPSSDGKKQPRPQKQSLSASLYMIGSYSLLMSGYTSADIIETAIINWIEEDSVSMEQDLDSKVVAQAMIEQFIIDEIIVKEQGTAQMDTGERFHAHGTTDIIQELRLTTMLNMWDNAKPKIKPMLHKLTWSINGTCELKNLTFKEDVRQTFVDSMNRAGWTGYSVNSAIRAEIKRNIKRGNYPKDQIQAMKEMLKLDPTKVYYFPHTPDYRGRFYARGGLTTFQGVKDIRAAFDFATLTKVDEYGLFLHIANAYGYDKVSITERMQWVRDNHIALMTVPALSLYAERARLAYIEYKNTGMTNIVARIDGTCSGVQITSGLFLDQKTAEAVNVSASNPDDQPADLYGMVADLAIKIAKKGMDIKLLKKYHRDLTKKLIMILAYGAGETTLINTLKEFLIENKERTSQAKSLYTVIMKAISEEFSAVTKLNEHLQLELECEPLTKLSYQLSDIKVKFKPTNTEHLNLHGTSYTAKMIGKRVPDSAALARGIAPNFVHSLDSELLRKAINIIDGDISVIHDDVGVQTGDVRKALQATRTAYYEVIKAEPLKELYNGMNLLSEYEPENNGLDLQDVLESAYLFS